MNWRFVGRIEELEAIRQWSSRQRYLPLVIYGPEGCGKTTLFREVVKRFSGWFPDGEIIYIDAEAWGPAEAIRTTRENVNAELADLVASWAGAQWVNELGRFAARIYPRLVEKIRELLQPERLLVAVDEIVKAHGLESIESVVKAMYHEMDRHLRERKKIVNYMGATSEGESRYLLERHTYVQTVYIWNLPRRDFQELYEQSDRKIEFEDAWRICGGNPRCLTQLYALDWNTERYIHDLLNDKRLRRVVIEAKESRLAGRLHEVVEDPDVLEDGPLKLFDILTDANLVTDISDAKALTGKKPPKELEIGIGEKWAWTLPAYRIAVRRLLL